MFIEMCLFLGIHHFPKLFDGICCLVSRLCLTLLWPHGLWPARLLCPWDFLSKNTGLVCHFLPQGTFLTQESNRSLLHWQADSLLLMHQGSPFDGMYKQKNCEDHSLKQIVWLLSSHLTSLSFLHYWENMMGSLSRATRSFDIINLKWQ